MPIEITIPLTSVIILVAALWGIREYIRNNAQPVTSVPARVISNHREPATRRGKIMVNRACVITFELTQTGEEKVFRVPFHEGDLLAVGDCGTLIFQGSRRQFFRRQPSSPAQKAPEETKQP
ncbi:MAG: DUF2500 domain-containing protein [Oscillospiraceae bacterium]|nr:DUF2500 domain-containing protein [Oscillospiraceae bacterium]